MASSSSSISLPLRILLWAILLFFLYLICVGIYGIIVGHIGFGIAVLCTFGGLIAIVMCLSPLWPIGFPLLAGLIYLGYWAQTSNVPW